MDNYVLITGGAGFIGSNLADRLLAGGEKVVLYDNLSRQGGSQNYKWLRTRYGRNVILINADIDDAAAIKSATLGASSVFHLAAQVAVTRSLEDPLLDFKVNALGTLHVLEALRQRPVPLVFTSTNKVYGGLRNVAVKSGNQRYEPVDVHIRENGIGECQALEFASPYGCSKGAADQYVIDYAHTFGLPAVVFRMSCIYGPRQFGTEDQGWVAHFALASKRGEALTVYGDGRQVRDILFIGDLLDAFELARSDSERLGGQAFNIGGGARNSVSLLEVIDFIEAIDESSIEVYYDDWRMGDQRYYVSDFRRFHQATGWSPKIGISEGLRCLCDWVEEHCRSTTLAFMK